MSFIDERQRKEVTHRHLHTSDGTLDVVDEDQTDIFVFDESLSEKLSYEYTMRVKRERKGGVEFTLASGGDLFVTVFLRLISSQWLLDEVILAEWIGTPGDFEGCPCRSIAVAKQEAGRCKERKKQAFVIAAREYAASYRYFKKKMVTIK